MVQPFCHITLERLVLATPVRPKHICMDIWKLYLIVSILVKKNLARAVAYMTLPEYGNKRSIKKSLYCDIL